MPLLSFLTASAMLPSTHAGLFLVRSILGFFGGFGLSLDPSSFSSHFFSYTSL